MKAVQSNIGANYKDKQFEEMNLEYQKLQVKI